MSQEKTELIILGSTGSIGRQTLEVVRAFPDFFKVVGLSANRNVALLKEQAREFHPRHIAIVDQGAYAAELPDASVSADILIGEAGLTLLCCSDSGDMVVNALAGMAGIAPMLAALAHGKDVAVANKEPLVSAGAVVMKMAHLHKRKIIPIDSEPSAIYQCIQGEHRQNILRIILTASGGPFRTASPEVMCAATIEEALAHPTWKMGKKVTIDSATLMNKGFEVIEAMHLFGLPSSKIDIVVHPQSIIHSMVEFVDHSTIVQLGNPDMRIPIQYALMGGMRHENNREPLDLVKIGTLTFEPVDMTKFPCLRLAREAAEKGGTYPAALTVANDYLVDKFLCGEIPFMSIPHWVEFVLALHLPRMDYTVEDVFEVRDWVIRLLDAHRKYLPDPHAYVVRDSMR